MIEQKTLATILSDLTNKSSREMNCAIPAIIQKYDHKTQKASVKVNIKRVYQDSVIDMPVLSNVPVMFMSCGGASLTMPVKKGDSCLLIFCDIDIKSWLLGGDNLKPQTNRIHSLNDAIALTGLNPFNKAIQVENNEDVLLQYSGSKIRLKPNGVVNIESAKELNIKTENVVINCKTANIKASNDISIECANASVKASGVINTETATFTQKGNLKVDGNIEVTGTSKLTGALTTENGINNSGANLVSNGKTFETHTHIYNEATTVMVQGVPTPVSKAPSSSGATQ